MPPLPRGTCISCARSVAMRTSGVVREHRATPRGGHVCRGASMRSKEEIERSGSLTSAELEVAEEIPFVGVGGAA